uniref:SET domain-containing protein n=1 Tax=Trichogramma kaykai TaxID=54128 RepID=A0ABD2VX96_9HYME
MTILDAECAAIIYTLSRPQCKDFASRLDIKYKIKNGRESAQARKEGTDLENKENHTDEDHKMILCLYNKSIAYAPRESKQLMYAYSNQAYSLMHVDKFNEAIDRLDRAIQLTDSIQLKLKLYCQKAICLAALGSSVKDDLMREIDQIFEVSNLPVESANFILNIIRKTKSEVATMKKFKPKNQEFLQEKQRYNKIIMDREKVDPFDFVEIKQTENMGRGLYAKTDFKTGDLVLVEKPYLIGPNFSNRYVFCSHCLSVAWTGIPCETCHDYIFCSLKCKNMAWEEYHCIECSITPYLILCDPEITLLIHTSLKFLISLVKDNKTIQELKSKLKISTNGQVKMMNDKSDQKINLFNELMSLSYTSSLYQNIIFNTVKALICMAKYTSFFSEKLKNRDYEDLSKDEDFLFFGSLLLRLVHIEIVNVHEISDPIFESNNLLAKKSTRSRGYCLGLISSMTNHSCAPNIRRCFTDDMKHVFYATEPIASGTELLDSYTDCFYESPLTLRIEQRKNFVCKCIACEQDWPPLFSPLVQKAFMDHKMKFEPTTYSAETNFIKRIYPLVAKMNDPNYSIGKDLMQTLTDLMNEIASVLPQPSLARCTLLQVLDEIFVRYYGLTEPFENICSTLLPVKF